MDATLRLPVPRRAAALVLGLAAAAALGFAATRPALAAAPDLTATVSVVGPLYAGRPPVYTLVVANRGDDGAKNIEVLSYASTDVLDARTSDPRVRCAVGGGVLRCSITYLAPGDLVTAVVSLAAPAMPGDLTVKGIVDPANTIAESDELNNYAA